MSFEKLLDNLIFVLRERINNGELTERRLAKIVGMSQPHIHNVLKGVRLLTPDLSDRILKGIKLSISDLIGGDANAAGIPLLEEPVGPEQPYPRERYSGSYPVAPEISRGLMHPAVFRLARDREMEPELVEKDVVLVDRSPDVRRSPDERSLYLAVFSGSGLVRYIRRRGDALCMATCRTRDHPELWQSTSLERRDILEVIRGRIVWIGRQMETTSGPVDETGAGTGSPGRAGRESGARNGSGGYGPPPGRSDAAHDLCRVHSASECSDDPDRDGVDAGGLRSGDLPGRCAQSDPDEPEGPHCADPVRSAGSGAGNRRLPPSLCPARCDQWVQPDAA